MSSVRIDVGFICLLLLALVNTLLANDAVCKYTKQHGYLAADCSNLKLNSVPTNVRSDVEVLDLSDNRIRELENTTFKCCTSIKFLYLQVNTIYRIEPHAFLPLTELTVLDLGANVLLHLPLNLPPTLKRLYLDVNPTVFKKNETPLSYELQIAPLKNLEFLSLGACGLRRFPTFGGSIPNLVQLNISNNPLEEIAPDDLAPLCQLKFLHVSSDKLFQSKDRLCECLKLERWTSTYDIKVESFTCKYDKSTSIDKCDLNASNVTLAKYQSCLTEMKNRQIPYWVMVVGGILAAIICISILLYVRYRRRQRETSDKNGRNSAVKYDNKTEENGGINPAFNGYGGGRGVETTV